MSHATQLVLFFATAQTAQTAKVAASLQEQIHTLPDGTAAIVEDLTSLGEAMVDATGLVVKTIRGRSEYMDSEDIASMDFTEYDEAVASSYSAARTRTRGRR